LDGLSGDRYARRLFGSAAIFNITVGAALLFLWPWLASLLKLDPAEGSNIVLLNLTACFVGLFGYAFALVAVHPPQYRPLISLGAMASSLPSRPWFGNGFLEPSPQTCRSPSSRT
jgi:hypothetical protein